MASEFTNLEHQPSAGTKLIQMMGGVADVCIVGAGLAGGLIAHRLRTLHPRLAVALVDAGPQIGGHHTWSFHHSDVSPAALEWLSPLTVKSWSRQRVEFPLVSRQIDVGYSSIRSDRFHSVIAASVGTGLALRTRVAAVEPHRVLFEEGELKARAVFDARGWGAHVSPCGYQKFVGLDVRLEQPHGLSDPIIMDAVLPQLDGFRFMYILPWDERRLLVEETYYSDNPVVNSRRIRRSIGHYITRKGWGAFQIEREEQGVLPIPFFDQGDDIASAALVPRVGAAGGLFHSVTGYSLPDAVRLTDRLTQLKDLTTESALACVRAYASECQSNQSFYRKLNRLLFRAAEPTLRYQILQRFYGLGQSTIENFYAGRSTLSDRVRIMVGKPPVRVSRALEVLRESRPETQSSAHPG